MIYSSEYEERQTWLKASSGTLTGNESAVKIEYYKSF